MRLLGRGLLCAASSVFALWACAVTCTDAVKVSALSGGRLMDTTEALSVFGSTFEVTYYNGSDYVTTTASYTGGTRQLQSDVGQYSAGAMCLQYTAPVVNLSANPQYITLQIEPQYSIFNTTQLHTAVFVYGTGTAAVPPYQTPDWRWMVSGQEQIFYGELDSDNNIDTVYVASDRCFYIPVDISSQSTFAANSVRCSFVAPVTVDSGMLWFYLAPPYLSSDAFGDNGISTTTSSSSGSGGGVTSEDLDETNGLLSSLINAVDGLIDGILSLFIPSEEFLEDWVDDMEDLLHDHLGGLYEAIDEITDYYDDFAGVAALQSIHIDACNVPLAGTTLTLGNWDVPLHSQALPQLFYDALAYIIDFLAVAAFLNMCKRKVTIFLSPDSEVINDDY